MRNKNSIQSIRSSYRRRQQVAPLLVGFFALILVLVGALFVVIAFGGNLKIPFMGGGGLKISLFASRTPTPTLTYTPTITPSPTLTPTITETPTLIPTEAPSATATPSGPFTYVIKEGDVLINLAQQWGIDLNYLMSYNKLEDGNIFVGQELVIPLGVEPPTVTPIPTYLPKGRVIEIIIKPNDSFNAIASTYNSTIEGILKENEDAFGKIDLKNDPLPALKIGMRLKVPANLVTRTPTTTPAISVRQTQTQAAIQTVMGQPTQQ